MSQKSKFSDWLCANGSDEALQKLGIDYDTALVEIQRIARRVWCKYLALNGKIYNLEDGEQPLKGREAFEVLVMMWNAVWGAEYDFEDGDEDLSLEWGEEELRLEQAQQEQQEESEGELT